MATATLPESPLVGVTPSQTKRRAKRLGTVTVSLFALIALGISLAFFLSNEKYAENEATGGTLEVVAAGLPLTADDLFPTNAADGGANAREGAFTVDNVNPATVAYSLTAACDNCLGEAEASQWESLYIIIEDADGKEIYRGRLADMNEGYKAPSSSPVSNPIAQPGTPAGGPADLGTIDPETAEGYTTRIWLDESGQEQPQGVLSSWTFDVEARTV